MSVGKYPGDSRQDEGQQRSRDKSELISRHCINASEYRNRNAAKHGQRKNSGGE